MKNKSRHIFHLMAIPLLLTLANPGFSQKSSVDQNRLNRDLRIMEGVLNKLLKGKTTRHFINGRTKAVYLPGFGIVFHTNQEGPVYHELNVALRKQYEAVQSMAAKVQEEHEVLREKMEEKREEIEEAVVADKEAELLRESETELPEEILDVDSDKLIEEEKRTIENFKENIVVFFRNYASAIGQLQPQDRLAVLVNLTDWELVDSENAFLSGWVTKQDVDRYRRNQISEPDFKKSIHFQLAESESEVDMDIIILSEIFDRAMDSSSFWGKPTNNGIYLNGLGALLFMELPSMFLARTFDDNLITVLSKADDIGIAYVPGKVKTAKKIEEKEKTQEEVIQEIQDELFELMASYGHTLRIKPQESVILNVNMGSRLFNYAGRRQSPSHLILQLNKKDLDEYNRGFITIDSLKKRLVRQTY